VFTPGASDVSSTEGTTSVSSTADSPPVSPGTADSPPVSEGATTTDENLAAKVNKLSEKEQTDLVEKTIKQLTDMGIDLSVFKPAIEKLSAAPAAGGAKKKRRKTKKNIRRNKKAHTKFGRKF
jgi:hypothetical protein